MNTSLPLLCAYLIGVSAVSATTLTFDDASNGQIANNYGGLNWLGFNVVNGVTTQPTGSAFPNSVVSSSNVVADIDGRKGVIQSFTPINLISAYFTAVYNDGLNLEIQGFSGSTLLFDKNFTVNTKGPELLTLNYTGVTSVDIIPSGGQLDPLYSVRTVDETDFAMDNLTFTTPEGGVTAILLGVSFAGLALWRKRSAMV